MMGLASEDPSEIEKLPELKQGDTNAVKYEFVDGVVHLFPCLKGKCFPTEQQKIFAEFVCLELNQQLHHDGSWRVVLSEPVRSSYDHMTGLYRSYVPTKLECQFLDAEGDPQFVVGFEQNIKFLIEWGLHIVLQHCECGYNEWESMMEAISINEAQKYRPHLGEKPTSVEEQYAVD